MSLTRLATVKTVAIVVVIAIVVVAIVVVMVEGSLVPWALWGKSGRPKKWGTCGA